VTDGPCPPGTPSPVPLVLHVIPTAVARGAQREARAIADRLERPGVRHHRILSLFAAQREVEVDYELAHGGGRNPATGMDLRLVLRLRRCFGRLDPALVVAHGGDPLKYVVPASLGRRRPLVYYATGTFARSDSRSRVALWGTMVRRAAVVAAEGQEVLEECRRLWRIPDPRLVLAPNGRDPEEFRPRAPSAEPEQEKTPVIAFVGALNSGKRPDVFIEVVAELRRRGLHLRAVVCGDGPLAGTLTQPAERAGVELLGVRPDVAEVLREADIFLFPSLPTGEGMPGVLIEAGLSGLPVVATAVPGVNMIVAEGSTGYVVEPNDFGAMVESTSRLVKDPGLRRQMGSAARLRCEHRFSVEKVAATWSSFIEPLVDGPGR
jgi:glycosyltransferase involved in cell wall biosynthesis